MSKNFTNQIFIFLGLMFFWTASFGNPLPRPDEFRALLQSHSSVRLVWSYSGEGLDNFIIERKVGTGSFAQLTTVTGAVGTFTNTGLTEGTSYTYRIRGKKGTLFSGYTQEQSVKIPVKKDFIPAELSYRKGVNQALDPIEDVYSWNGLTVNSNYDVFQTPPCLAGEYYVGFELSYDRGDFNTEVVWTADLELVFLQGTTVLWTKPINLKSATGTWTGTVFHDVPLSCTTDYKFKIQSKSGQGPLPVANLMLRKRLFRKVRNSFVTTQEVGTIGAGYSSGVSTVSWTYDNAEFREFDVEWVFVSTYDTQVSTASAAFFQREGVRVRVTGTGYIHRVYYPPGKLYYRVRAVGYHPDFPERKIAGVWEYGSNSGMAVNGSGSTAKNWQSRIDFIEGGKFRRQVSYLDGTLRSRQEVSSLNTNNYVLISETWYDYEGRAVLSFLPAAEPSPSLAFRANYNAFNNSTSSTLIFPEIEGTKRIKYHYDNGSILDNTTWVGSGSSKYYSSSNALNNTITVNKKYIPSAGGFPYVATEYTHDPTGRVSKQGQTGGTLKIDGTRTTRKFYGQAYPEELIRLFGSNVGDAVHYRKEVTVDPNGQASVQYIDQEGRTIATALAGDSPPNLVVPLAEYTSKQSSGWGSVSYDLSAHNKREDSGKYIGASFINTTSNTSHVFSYNLTGIGGDLDQLGCQSCEFELSIRLLDPDGDWVSLPVVTGDESADPLEYAKKFTATDCQVEQAFGAVNMTVNLVKVGEYRIVKKLVTREKTVETLLQLIRSEQGFISQKTAVENSFVADPASCEWCLEDCPEAGEAVASSIEDLVNQELNAVLERIRTEILDGLPQGTTLTAQELNQQVLNHQDYCEYELLRQTKDSRVFEYRLALTRTWTEYQATGELLIDKDPLYNLGGIGAGKKITLESRLNTLMMGGFSGTLEQLTDPGNAAYRVNALGQPAPNGVHFLYYDLLSKQNSMPPSEFAQRMDEQRWSMYSSFYLNESRKMKREISQFAQCQAWLDQNDQFNENPTDQQIQDYLNDSGLLDQISDDELDQVLNQVINSGRCVATFSAAEQNTMRESLRNYLNSNRQGNLFNLILEEDLNSPLLTPLKNVLTSKSCSLSNFAIPNPMECLTYDTIVIPDPNYGGIYRMSARQSTGAKEEERNEDLLLTKEETKSLQEIEKMLYARMQQEKAKMESKKREEERANSSRLRGRQQSSTNLRVQSSGLPTQAEYDALMDFYVATNGANWTSKTGWSTANPNVIQSVAGFAGVATNANGNVLGIFLMNNNIVGELPESFGDLIYLEQLYLGSNNLYQKIPQSIGNLVNLKGLYLNSSRLNWHEIPETIGNLANLEYLHLHSNFLQGTIPASIGNLSKLRELYLLNTKLTGEIPAGIGNLSLLAFMRMENSLFEGPIPASFSNLTQMVDIRLHNNQLTGPVPSYLCSFPNLTTVTLHENYLTGTLPTCLFSKNLSYLWVANNNFSIEGLVEMAANISNTSDFLPQRQPVDTVSVQVMENGILRLTTDMGRNTTQPSKYRWVKNGVPLFTDFREDAYSYENPAIPCLYNDNGPNICNGTYYPEITNPGLPPGTIIKGRPIKIETVPTIEVEVCTSYQLDPEFNPWLAGAVYERPWADIVAQCVAEQAAVVEKVQEAAVAQLERSWIERYYDSGTTECLEGAKETLTMTVTNKEYHHTLYYYDQSGNLAQTVPPNGVKPLSTAQVNQVKTGTVLYPAHELVTGYRYNSKNQLVWQNSPDGGTSRFWYNAIGQLRMSQNARQQTANQYSYTKYDAIGRVIETGEMASTAPLDTLVARIKVLDFPQRPGYTCTDITLTGYDRPKTGLSPHLVQDNLRGRVSWTAQLEKGKTDTLLTAYSYDPHGNVKTLVQQIPGLAPKKTEYQYDLVSGNVNYVAYQPGTAEQLIHRYRYDADNRIEQVLTSTDGHVWSTDATYYYYPHGPLARVELGEHKVQGLDYYYTLQGWLKGVNMPRAGDPGADGIGTKRTGKDAMAFALGYFNGDYAPITSGTVLTDTRDAIWTRTSTLNANSGLYNGNITWMNTDLPGSQDANDMQAMVYKYDQLHRIVQARSLRAYTTSFTSRTASSTGAYDANYTYDGNGNLLTLQRRNAAAAIQDNFNYGYYANSNKLRQTASAQGNNYEYDAIGNLTKDVAGGVTNIEWTPSGKVRKVTKSTGSPIEFRYDAAGNRVEKKQGTTITRYIRDASGNVMAVYQADTILERPIYGSSRLGNLSYASKPGYRTVGHKQYELSNHLGNVLAVVSDRIRMKTDSTWTQVLSRTDYYPFGLEMTGRTESATYRYGFNGKEKDPSGQWSNQAHYDYGFRIYNPTIGKFLSVDPLTGSYPMLTPYQFASNRPIDGIDLDGLEFYKSTLYDFKIESGLGLMTDRELLSLRIVPNSQNFRYYNNFLIRRSTSPSLLNGVSTAIDLGNEFSDLGLNTNLGFGKGLVILGKANSFLGIYSEFSNAYDLGFEKGMQEKQREFNFTKARDIQRAEWVQEVIIEAFNSGVIVGDQEYLEKFANFALDGPPSGIEINAGLGLSVLDRNQVEKLNEDFAKLENFVNSDENKFIEVTNMGIDKGSKPKFIRIYDKKFKAKPD